ncbi:MAG TPA: Hsp20/alpha crystallin family protein [Candidatus Methylomirabilis sp.]|nr:Hsp20/alpha crystallin family protein [Candidatus Methylomirabilis sp.]HSC71652.1 Hsp20/alpha crystallin family protein [Candidatus Methylomirabilis sp.]
MPVWDPFAGLDALRREIDRTFDTFGSERWPQGGRVAFLPGRAARQYPLVNLSEDEGHLYVEALAPGVDPKTLDVSVLQGTLTIKGEKPGLAQVSAEAFHRNERAAGRFVRTIDLPTDVEASRVHADYRNGLLLVTLPKSEAAKPKQVPISVA